MLKERIATAIVLLGGFLAALFLLPTRQFAIPVAVIVALGAFEWAALAKTARAGRYGYAAIAAALFGAIVWGFQAIDPSRGEVALIYAVPAAFWMLIVPIWLARGWEMNSKPVALIVGMLVVVPAGLSVVSLHSIGPLVVLLLLAFVWIADISAYFVGRAIGKRKLAPAISPGKSWEGALGALAATSIYAIICAMVLPQLSVIVKGGLWILCLVIAALLWALSIAGDLFESLVKRRAGVKDSGTLLPGHGGVLDRIDSITSTLPVAALLFYLMTGGP
jgi:phosphatidate cytidylyltransferase